MMFGVVLIEKIKRKCAAFENLLPHISTMEAL